MNTIRATTAVSSLDIGFNTSIDTSSSAQIDSARTKVLSLINDVILAINENNERINDNKDNLAESWNNITDVMDFVLEKSDRYIDEFRRARNVDNGSTYGKGKNTFQYLDDNIKVGKITGNPRKKMGKPQLEFKTPIDNTESHPFKPLLTDKPFALKSLEKSTQIIDAEEGIPMHYANPYEEEIDNQPYNTKVLQQLEIIRPQDWDKTGATWVDSVDELELMIKELQTQTEIAVDLEHHDLRSYYGIVCLMQISSREKDWIVDTIKLRDHLQKLNTVFANPEITKVFHGAFMDIIWLQRDLGLYVVSLFDTYHASRALGFPKHSLAYLLEKFANFKTSKKYQLADWRIRPLTDAMFAYARSDTHFLLYIFDQLRNMLITKNKLADVLHESRLVAKRRFEYVKYRPSNLSSEVYCTQEKIAPWKSLMYNYNIPLDSELLLIKLYEWRDAVARREDESPRYIMPNQLLALLVSMKPTDPAGVMSISNNVTDFVRSNSKIIANIIKNACEVLASTQNGTKNQFKVVNKEDADDDEVLKLVSPAQVKYMNQQFEVLQGKLQKDGNISIAINPKQFHSRFFEGDWGNRVVSYQEDGEVLVADEKKLNERKKDIIKRLEEENRKTIGPLSEITLTTTGVDRTSGFDRTNEEKEAENPNNSQTNESKDSYMSTPDKDEIVVLKSKKRKLQSITPRVSAEKDVSESVEAIDYENSEKVMNLSKGRVRDTKGNKKIKFDPYTKEIIGPKEVKKRAKPVKGKMITFNKR
ncbi:exosome nuclease subunit RRP6 SCDLUD_000937 [Saccharomycodes ludwigii]|uniref:exosome nuclease subunit RRP6 n=1 Tax=Saccharomycodes ludwigii TaxID=36035 RepID=UPI001E84AC0E|nr:hypothetical protein SCDLUD_000937 [Saccharomycodes ludwigii]KAH3903312.1 hypothetical protein SCDLUD_000937 [Saccharomycodes ludwigii]